MTSRGGEDGTRRYDYCDRCEAFAYYIDGEDTYEDGEAFPTGTDRQRNCAAWDTQELRSPEAR